MNTVDRLLASATLTPDEFGAIQGLIDDNERLRSHVADLQSGMYINRVYCGHRYGPDPGTLVAMADVLRAHIEACPEHPMSKLRAEFGVLFNNYQLLIKHADRLEHPYNE